MKKINILIVCILMSYIGLSQISPDKYFVQFTDKNNSPYSIGNPSEFLSQKAIDRRSNQGISIVENDLPVNPSYVEEVAEIGVTVLNRNKWFNGITIYTTDPNALAQINALPFVQTVLKNKNKSDGLENEIIEKPFFANESIFPAKPSGSSQYKGSDYFDYGASYNQIHMIMGDVLHEMGYRGEGKTIAVLDAGFLSVNTLPAFDSLWNNNQILGTHDFVDGGTITFDKHTHGTCVLSIMGANLPGEIIGTAPKASYWLLRSEDGGLETLIEEYNWVSAAEFADSAGADIINSSLGYTEFDNPDHNHTYQDMDGNTTPVTRGADFAASKGIIVVNSAGNSGNSSWYYIGAPADGDSVFAIGAVNGAGIYTSFSSHGPTYDGRIKPNVVAQGEGTTFASPYGGIAQGNGTSFSSPVIAGMTACLWQANPSMKNMEITNAIQQSGSQASNPDEFLGYGIPDYVEANDMLSIIETPVSIQNNIINVYPLPFKNYINIVYNNKDDNSSVLIEIYDITAKKTLSITKKLNTSGLNKLTVNNLSEIPSGIYLMKIISNNDVSVSRLIKD